MIFPWTLFRYRSNVRNISVLKGTDARCSMSGINISYLTYPIYGIASNDTYIVTSGGGGGKHYGIEDLLEVNTLNEKEKRLETLWSTAEQKGVVDSIQYVSKYNIWIGSIKNECILFEIKEETGPRVLARFVTDFSEKHPRQVVAKFGDSEDLILTGGDDKTLRLWKLKLNQTGNGIPINVETESENDRKRKQKVKKMEKDYSTNVNNNNNNSNNDNSNNENSNNEHSKNENNNNTNKSTASKDIFFLNPQDAVEHLGDFVGHDDGIKDCDISVDNKVICTCASDYSLKIWDTYRFLNLCTEVLKNPKNKNDKLIFRSCKFLKKSKAVKEFHHVLLTTGSSVRGNSFLVVWDLYFNDKKEKFSFTKKNIIWLDEKPCCNMTVSSNENYFAFGFSTGSLKLYNSKFILLSHYKKQELPITAMCFSKNGKFLVAAGADYSVSCVDINAFTTSFLKKIYKFCIIVFILFIVLVILLDFFNVGFDLHVNSSIKRTVQKENMSSTHKTVHVLDEL